MGAFVPLSKKLMASEQSIHFMCPACKRVHSFRVTAPSDNWTYNGNPESPTFSPSLKETYNGWVPAYDGSRGMVRKEQICHLYLTDGVITYQSDCTHDMAGATIALPDWDSVPCD